MLKVIIMHINNPLSLSKNKFAGVYMTNISDSLYCKA